MAKIVDQQSTYNARTTDVHSTLTEPLLLSHSNASNTSLLDSFTIDLIIAGTSRWPSMYTLGQLHTSITVLFVALVVVSFIQLILVGLCKLFKRDAGELPE